MQKQMDNRRNETKERPVSSNRGCHQVALVIKGLKSTDASSVMASMRQENDSLKKQVEALVSSVSNVKSRMDRVENKVNSGLQTPKGKGPPATYKCNICGVAGDHWASKCPQKKEPKDDDKSEE